MLSKNEFFTPLIKMESEFFFSSVFPTKINFADEIKLPATSKIWRQIAKNEKFCRRIISPDYIWTDNIYNLVAICLVHSYDSTLIEILLDILTIREISIILIDNEIAVVYIYQNFFLPTSIKVAYEWEILEHSMSKLKFPRDYDNEFRAWHINFTEFQ